MKNLKNLFVLVMISLFAFSCGSESEDPQPKQNTDVIESDFYSDFIGNYYVEVVTIDNDVYFGEDEFCTRNNSESSLLFEFVIEAQEEDLFYERDFMCKNDIEDYVGEIDIEDDVIKFYRRSDNKDVLYSGIILEKTSTRITIEWLHVNYGKPVVEYSISN